MKTPLRLLMVEDSEQDEHLLIRELRRQGFAPEHERVCTAAEMTAALERGPWDLVISDYSMPGFDGLAAFALLQTHSPGVPFIICSGSVGEERAAAAIKAGATDYLMKGNLARLVPAVESALREARERRDHARAGLALATANTNFQALVENSIVGMYVLVEDKFVYVNPRMSEILGFTAAELLATSVVELAPPEDREGMAENLRAGAGETLRPFRYALRLRRKGGALGHFEVHGTRTEFHGRAATLGTLLDVTDRKQAEIALRQSEERFSKIFRSSPEGIGLSRLSDGRLVEVNDAFLTMFGFTREEVLGRTHAELDLWTDPDEQARLIGRVMERGQLKNVAASFRLRNGESGELLMSVEIVEVGGEKCALALFHDITEMKRIEAELHRNQRLESIGTLASGMAHDLNNVLSPILMAADVLQARHPGPLDQEILATLRDSARRGSDMVKQVLAFASGLQGEQVVFRPDRLIAEVRAILQETFPPNIRIQTVLPKDVWPLTGNATQLHQVLMNLCVNARDALADGGTLTIAVENIFPDEQWLRLSPDAKAGPHVAITVADTGRGMTPAVRDRIFEPFFTTKPPGKGTGLGLSTVRSIAQTHGGFVTVQSEPGCGAEFKIYLPAGPAKLEAAAIAPPDCAPLGSGEVILLVDDEASVRDIMTQILRMSNYETLAAQDGAQAVAVFAQHRSRIKVILTDLVMPIVDGEVLIRAVRTIEPSVKIIATSGSSELLKEASSTMPVQAILHKPFTAQKLLQTISEVIGLPVQ